MAELDALRFAKYLNLFYFSSGLRVLHVSKNQLINRTYAATFCAKKYCMDFVNDNFMLNFAWNFSASCGILRLF